MTKAKKKPAKSAATKKTAAKTKPQAKAPAEQSQGDKRTTYVKLKSLKPATSNVRSEINKGKVAEFKASILSVGVLQNLVVQASGKDSYTVIAGTHRLHALSELAKEGKISPDYDVPVAVVANDADVIEIGLAENTVRSEMNPLDACVAFQRLLASDKKLTVADVAAKFGTTETIVKKRLTLADMPKKITQAFRDGVINLEQLQAFAATDDHKLREKVFDSYNKRNGWDHVDGGDIRGMLTNDEVTADNHVARFVGVAAYEAAGGAVRRDLFCEDDSGIVILDPQLMANLADEKLAEITSTMKAEGWGWVQAKASYLSYSDHAKYEKLNHSVRKLTPSEEKTVKDLEGKLAKLDKIEEKNGGLSDEEQAQYDQHTDALQAIEDSRLQYSDKNKARAGVMIGIDNAGQLMIERGLVDPKDAKKEKAEAAEKAKANGDGSAPASAPEVEEDASLSKAVLENLTIHRSAALAAELAARPYVALAAVVYSLAIKVLYEETEDSSASCLQVTVNNAYARFGNSRTEFSGINHLLEAKNVWIERTPDDDTALWDWLLTQQQSSLLQMLAFLTAHGLNDINTDGGKHPFANRLASALSLDMSEHYTATKDNLFGRLGKPALLSIIREVTERAPTADEQKMKKDQLADKVEEITAGKKWLPPFLRFDKPEQPATTQAEEQGAKQSTTAPEAA